MAGGQGREVPGQVSAWVVEEKVIAVRKRRSNTNMEVIINGMEDI